MAVAQTKQMPKKLIFAMEWLKDRNATQAAVRAGYSTRTAHSSGPRLLADVEVQQFLKERTQQLVQETGIDAARVMKEVHLAAFFDPRDLYDGSGCLLPVPEMPEHARRAISQIEVTELFEWEGEGKDRVKVWKGYTKKVKMVSKEGTLTLAARHLGILHDKLEVKSDNIADLIAAAEQRAKGVK